MSSQQTKNMNEFETKLTETKETYKKARLPLTDKLATEQDMRIAIQALSEIVDDLIKRVKKLEK